MFLPKINSVWLTMIFFPFFNFIFSPKINLKDIFIKHLSTAGQLPDSFTHFNVRREEQTIMGTKILFSIFWPSLTYTFRIWSYLNTANFWRTSRWTFLRISRRSFRKIFQKNLWRIYHKTLKIASQRYLREILDLYLQKCFKVFFFEILGITFMRVRKNAKQF